MQKLSKLLFQFLLSKPLESAFFQKALIHRKSDWPKLSDFGFSEASHKKGLWARSRIKTDISLGQEQVSV
jgi:hypothetical protein